MRVLIAEDDVVSRRILQVTFFQWGYDVVACDDGAQAWNALQAEGHLRLAVLDWMMPEVDGVELCRRIRQTPGLETMYTILLTAKSSRKDVIEGLDAGADDFISKPFDRAELAARVRVGERILRLEEQREPHTVVS